PDQDPTYTVAPLQANNNPSKFFSGMWRFNPKPNMTNEFRIGFNLANSVFLDSQNIPNYFITGATYANPVSGVWRTQARHTNTFNVADNATWAHGPHTVQFGYQMQVVHIEQFNDAGITPSYSLGLGLNTAGLYVQDNWKVSRRLTATLGVRWDYYPATNERDSLALLPVLENNNVIQTVLDPNAQLNFAGNSVGRPWWNPSKRHFAPNVGLAWYSTGEGKWAIR